VAIQDRNKLIKLLGPSCSAEEIKAVERVLRSGWWGLGPVTEAFEQAFAKFVGVHHAVALNSCTAALHLSLKAVIAKVGRKGSVIVPALTFISSAAAALYEGCEVVFADVDERTFCLDPADVRRKITRDTIAIIPMHYAGVLSGVDNGKSHITIIEDCAHAAGTPGAGKTGKLSAWSFHAVKNIATGDGGMVTTDDHKAAEFIRRLRWMGIDRSTYQRSKKGKYDWEYDISQLGYKYHSNDIMSAIALVQLRRLKELNSKRRAIAERYNKAFRDLPIKLPPESGSWHLYVIRVDKRYRNRLIDFLRKRNISSSVHYKPLYYFPMFGWNIKEKGKSLPKTEKIWREIVSLPIFPDLTQAEQRRVITAIKDFFYNI